DLVEALLELRVERVLQSVHRLLLVGGHLSERLAGAEPGEQLSIGEAEVLRGRVELAAERAGRRVPKGGRSTGSAGAGWRARAGAGCPILLPPRGERRGERVLQLLR